MNNLLAELIEMIQQFMKFEANVEKKAKKIKKREKKIFKFKMDILEKMIYKVSLIRHCDNIVMNFMLSSSDSIVFKDFLSPEWINFQKHYECLKVVDEEVIMRQFYRFVQLMMYLNSTGSRAFHKTTLKTKITSLMKNTILNAVSKKKRYNLFL